jgi:hypothetical protein
MTLLTNGRNGDRSIPVYCLIAGNRKVPEPRLHRVDEVVDGGRPRGGWEEADPLQRAMGDRDPARAEESVAGGRH